MGSTLNLTECLLAMAVEAHEQGRTRDARNLLNRLLKFRDLPRPIAEEAHARLAELLIGEKQFRKARRHLAVLMCLRPSQAKYFYQFAVALHRDPKGDSHRAAKYYRQAIDLDPTRSRWWANYGKLLIELGRTPDAIAALQHGLALDENDPLVVSRIVEALCLDDQADEARTILRSARFRNPKDGRFRKLWNDFQFRRVVDSQRVPRNDEPILLPFVRRAIRSETGIPGTILRMDAVRPVAMPHSHSQAARNED